MAEAGIVVRSTPAIPPASLREDVAAGRALRMIAQRDSLDQRVVRVELYASLTSTDDTPRRRSRGRTFIGPRRQRGSPHRFNRRERR